MLTFRLVRSEVSGCLREQGQSKCEKAFTGLLMSVDLHSVRGSLPAGPLPSPVIMCRGIMLGVRIAPSLPHTNAHSPLPPPPQPLTQQGITEQGPGAQQQGHNKPIGPRASSVDPPFPYLFTPPPLTVSLKSDQATRPQGLICWLGLPGTLTSGVQLCACVSSET